MNFKEMKSKTGLQAIGILDAITSYVGKNSQTYYSADLIISGVKEKINVRLPDQFDRSKLVVDELAKFTLSLDRFGNYVALVVA